MRVAPFVVLALAAAGISPAHAAETVTVPAFKAVELHDGGHVVVRPGAAQRVTIIEGSRQYTRITVRDDKLRIDNCFVKCPRGYRLRVEVVTPSIMALAVNDGGIVRTEGTFASQNAVAAAVHDGGIVDARGLPGESVAAAVDDGGRVLVSVRTSLAVAINDGGHVTYWGRPANIVKSVRDGGAVSRGAPGDIGKPLSALSPRAEAPPPVPPVPPVPDLDDEEDD